MRTKNPMSTGTQSTRSLTIKTGVKAGGLRWNHNETQATGRTRSLTIKTSVKAGGYRWNHNEAQADARTRGLNVKTSVKAGPVGLHNLTLKRGTGG